MKEDILSLKNIYRIITAKDYPIHTEGIAKPSKFKGNTLLKFWNSMLIPLFTNGPYGSIIWRHTTTRNRYLSDICNRSNRLPLYSKYTQEILSSLTPDIFLDQILQFMDYLYSLSYSYKTLEAKLNAFFSNLSLRDPLFDEKIFESFVTPISQITSLAKTTISIPADSKYSSSFDEIKTFSHAWFLSMITLHALTGTEMSGEQMDFFRSNIKFQPINLYNAYQIIFNKQSMRKALDRVNVPLFVTTSSKSLLHDNALPAYRFFGRETELYVLCNFISKGGHYFLSGNDGSGKTELINQFINIIRPTTGINRIAYMDYADSIKNTFEKSFKHSKRYTNIKELYTKEAQIYNTTLTYEHIFNAMLIPKHHNILVVIDNVPKAIENDILYKKLSQLPQPIILITKANQLYGFEKIPVKILSSEAAVLIFLDNYSNLNISHKEYINLLEIFEHNAFRLPRTLIYIAKILSNTNSSFDEIIKLFRDFTRKTPNGSSNELLFIIKARYENIK